MTDETETFDKEAWRKAILVSIAEQNFKIHLLEKEIDYRTRLLANLHDGLDESVET